ncbi:MAG: universal stress protein [Gammaproteobacteria bacterium]|nr:universal stress protein [Gammaproteobacteria bacterium]MYF39149.1 universal stress protein [Gammaproteobacteria bacterium]
MNCYSRILLAVDLTDSCKGVAQQAARVADQCEGQLHIVHVVEPQSLAYGDEVPIDLTSLHDAINDQAASYLREFSKEFNIPEDRQHLVFGVIHHEIHRIAREQSMDLIVVGSHGRHGLAILFGSTLNDVIQAAHCDVLAVRAT